MLIRTRDLPANFKMAFSIRIFVHCCPVNIDRSRCNMLMVKDKAGFFSPELASQPLADFRIQPVGIDPLEDAAQGGLRGRPPAFRFQLLERLAVGSLSSFGNSA